MNSVDVVIDSCAITCNPENDMHLVIQKISNLLKTGGHFITVCDTSLTSVSGNFINPHSWIDLCTSNGLELVGEYTETTNNLFVTEPNYQSYGVLNVVRLVFKKA